MPKRKLKKAYKTLKFWLKVLKKEKLLDDPEHKLELQVALLTIKDYSRKE